jgi:L-rhamnose-H+ transport protein
MRTGIAIVVLAGFLQGTFVLPMTLTTRWKWEHTWLVFSAAGMIVFNWLLAWLVVPDLLPVLLSTPRSTVLVLIGFGLCWGAGAVLFGIGMERLGMSVGYPIIMGLIACLGTLIPLAWFFPEQLLRAKGLYVIVGTAVTVAGIVLCSAGAGRRQAVKAADVPRSARGGVLVAIAAGVLSCLPNVGVAFGKPLVETARAHGASPLAAGSAVWVVLFTAGGILNCAYCARRLAIAGSAHLWRGRGFWRNLALGALMAALWIAGFHLYGVGQRSMGEWGPVYGWPVFISLSIGVGVLWGLLRGEWAESSGAARRMRNYGLLALLAADVILAASQSL